MPDARVGLGSDAILGAFGTESTTNGTYEFTRQSVQDIQTVDQYQALWATISQGDTALANAKVSVNGFSSDQVTSQSYKITAVQIEDPLALASALTARADSDPVVAAILARPDTRVITEVGYLSNFNFTEKDSTGLALSFKQLSGVNLTLVSKSGETITIGDQAIVAYRASMLCWNATGVIEEIVHDRPGVTAQCPSGLTNSPSVVRSITAVNWPDTLTVSQARDFPVVVKMPDGSVVNNPNVTWQLANGALGNITSTQPGVAHITGLQPGNTFLTATAPGSGFLTKVFVQHPLVVVPDPCAPVTISGTTVNGTISASSCSIGTDKGDHLRLVLTTQQNLAFDLSSGGAPMAASSQILLTDTTGTLLASSNYPVTRNDTITSVELGGFFAPGTYLVSVIPKRAVPTSAIPYQLNVLSVGGLTPACGFNQWVVPGVTFSASTLTACQYGTATQPDWIQNFNLYIPAGSTIRLTVDYSAFGNIPFGALLLVNATGVPVLPSASANDSVAHVNWAEYHADLAQLVTWEIDIFGMPTSTS